MTNTNSLENKKCGQCSHFIGFGDFSLCCDLKYDLVYANTDACSQFYEGAFASHYKNSEES